MISAVLTRSADLSVRVSPSCLLSCLHHRSGRTPFGLDWYRLAIGSYFLFDYPYSPCFFYFCWCLVPQPACVSHKATFCLFGLSAFSHLSSLMFSSVWLVLLLGLLAFFSVLLGILHLCRLSTLLVVLFELMSD